MYDEEDSVDFVSNNPEDEELDPFFAGKIRLRAVILLVIFLLPSILVAIEVITGGLTRSWQELIKPFLDDPRILQF
mgnify:CR=1 FL=1|jgi:hypothetical protein